MDYEKILSKYDYAELRLEQSTDALIRIADGELRQVRGTSSGISVRILIGGSWGFASGSGHYILEDLLKKAEKLACLSGGKINVGQISCERKDVLEKIPFTDMEAQAAELKNIAKELSGTSIISSSVSCSDSVVETEYYNSSGSEIRQKIGYSYLSCSAVAKSGNIIQRASERSWSRTGFCDLDFEIAQKAREKVLRLLGANPPPSGRFSAVLDSEMTGVFSHEAVGHACEADSVVERESTLAGKIGKRIGNELVSITDDPGANNFGRYAYDDEGVRAKPAILVKNGVLMGYMTSRETACSLGLELNGHARADGFDSVPVIRMSNTYFQRGKSSKEDVFDVRSGIYLKGMRGGSVDIFSGGFMFSAEEAYEIKNGELGNNMRDVTITGNILKTLKDVEAVGKDFGTSPGICGKFGQDAPVSDGGPHIRVKNLAVG